MDMSFANQALCAEYMVKNANALQAQVYDVPTDIDREVAASSSTPWASPSTPSPQSSSVT